MLRLKKRRLFALRFAGCALAFIGLSALVPNFGANAWYSSLMFLGLFGVTIPMLKLCYDIPWRNIVFCAVAAYTVQHFAFEFVNLIFSFIARGKSPIFGLYDNAPLYFNGFDKTWAFNALIFLLCYVAAYSAMYMLFAKRIKKSQDMKIKSVALLLLVGTGLLVNILLNSFLIYEDVGFTVSVVLSVTNMLCCILLLFGQFSLLLTKELRHELEFVNKLWHQEKEQYSISKENIDLINLKCHDMRHHIREIGKSKSLSPEVIKEIESSISLYDSMVKTGNEVLDIILTEKSLRCHKNGIILTCVADGALLNFIEAADLYSLFGNALDNAIEAVLKIGESDNRIIGLRIHGVGDMVTVNINNSFAGDIDFDEQGYPKTTKEDSKYHGYGVKSINFVVEKYNGNVSIVAKDGIFNLNMLIPVPESARRNQAGIEKASNFCHSEQSEESLPL